MRKSGLRTVVFLLLAATLLMASEFKLVPTSVVPSAEGAVKAEKDRNGNTKLEIGVRHLAPPQRLTPPQQNYALWVASSGQPPRLVGELRVNENQEGSLVATVPEKVFDVAVTAESTPTPETPSKLEVMRGHVDMH